MKRLNDNHYRVLLYKERFTKEDAQEIMLNNDLIIFMGRVYSIKCEAVGADVYEISKDIDKYNEGNNTPVKQNLGGKLESVLCTPDGKVCISGSEKDREIIQEVINELKK